MPTDSMIYKPVLLSNSPYRFTSLSLSPYGIAICASGPGLSFPILSSCVVICGHEHDTWR